MAKQGAAFVMLPNKQFQPQIRAAREFAAEMRR
jgi:hypothetical protein